MAQPRVLVIGGSGFIGRSIVARLAADGRKVLVPTRRELRARNVMTLPGVEVEQANVLDRTELAALVARVDVVINLVGILHSRSGQPYGPDFAKLHVDLPHNIVAAMQATPDGPRRLLHMSALGADKKAPSMYLRSKADGEAVVRGEAAAAGVALTVFRPSVVFGPDDSFLNLFARLAKITPVLALGGARARFQPVFVGDVAQAFANALENPATYGHAYSLCGPRIYTLRELVRLSATAGGTPRPVIALPDALARMQAWCLEHMPGGPLMSRDNLDSMRLDNIAPAGWAMAPELGLAPLTSVEQHLATGLYGDGADGQFNFLRARGRR
jgi:NADH dehydrogenase